MARGLTTLAKVVASRFVPQSAALRDPIRAKVLRACAAHLRTQEYQRTHRRAVEVVRRYNPRDDRWCTQRVAGDFDDQEVLC